MAAALHSPLSQPLPDYDRTDISHPWSQGQLPPPPLNYNHNHYWTNDPTHRGNSAADSENNSLMKPLQKMAQTLTDWSRLVNLWLRIPKESQHTKSFWNHIKVNVFFSTERNPNPQPGLKLRTSYKPRLVNARTMAETLRMTKKQLNSINTISPRTSK